MANRAEKYCMKVKRSLFPLYVYGNGEQNSDGRRTYASDATQNRPKSAFVARTAIDTLEEKMPVIPKSSAVFSNATVDTRRFERQVASLLLYYIAAQYTGALARGVPPPLNPPLPAQPDAETEKKPGATGPGNNPADHGADPD